MLEDEPFQLGAMVGGLLEARGDERGSGRGEARPLAHRALVLGVGVERTGRAGEILPDVVDGAAILGVGAVFDHAATENWEKSAP